MTRNNIDAQCKNKIIQCVSKIIQCVSGNYTLCKFIFIKEKIYFYQGENTPTLKRNQKWK